MGSPHLRYVHLGNKEYDSPGLAAQWQAEATSDGRLCPECLSVMPSWYSRPIDVVLVGPPASFSTPVPSVAIYPTALFEILGPHLTDQVLGRCMVCTEAGVELNPRYRTVYTPRDRAVQVEGGETLFTQCPCGYIYRSAPKMVRGKKNWNRAVKEHLSRSELGDRGVAQVDGRSSLIVREDIWRAIDWTPWPKAQFTFYPAI